MEQQRDQAATAASSDGAASSASMSAAPSGVRLGVSSRPALPTPPAPAQPAPDAASAPPEEQPTLLGSLAPHVEPRAVHLAETDSAAASASRGHAMAQPPQLTHPSDPQPASSAPANPRLPSDGYDASAVPDTSAASTSAAMPDAPALPPAVDQPPPTPPAPAAMPAPPPAWQAPAGRQPLPGHAPPVPAHAPAHVPWQAAESWGATTITIEANTAAGASYLFWWVSGLLVYFNERHNRFVRFHAMQSILLTGALTVFSVLALIISSLFGDVAQYARDPLIRHLFGTLGWGILVMAGVIVLFVWVPAMVAAWAGNYLRLPIVGRYAERYSAPPFEPTQPPLY